MKKHRDIFRPRREPACLIYDALLAESRHRKKRTVEDWILAERLAVWKAARDYAQQHGLKVLELADIERAETSAVGSADYAQKLAYRVGDMLAEQKGDTG